MANVAFKVGDEVQWRSQSQGSWKTKVGKVVEVVSEGFLPSREKYPSLHGKWGCGLSRSHESYVVMVGNKPYWPRVGALSKSEAVNA